MKITIINSQKKIPIYPKRIKKTILKLFSSKDRKKSGEISISFVSDKRIRQLNKLYHGRDCPTDVLAFDIANAGNYGQVFADIVVSVDTASRNAVIFKTTPFYELNLYVVHGLLHLLGYRDNTQTKKLAMQKKAEEILGKRPKLNFNVNS